MGLNRRPALILFWTLLLVGCAGAFPYKHYGLSDDIDFSRGKLLGPKPAQDEPFFKCASSPQIKHPCVIMKAGDFYKMKQEYESMAKRLEELERRGLIPKDEELAE